MKRYNQTVLALISIILPICHGDGIFDSFQASLNEVKNYAADILPYVKEGVQMVQKAEKFVDSAIGEDCSYECDKEGTNLFMLQILIWARFKRIAKKYLTLPFSIYPTDRI